MNAPPSLKVMLLAACLCTSVADLSSHAAISATAGVSAVADGSIFVRLEVPKRELYVGESVPVVIEVGAQDDVVAALDSPPTLRGDAFTLDVLTGEPDREQRVIDGRPYTLLAWHSVLAAIKPGGLSLTIDAPLTVRVPVPQEREPTFVDEAGDPYSDPAFQSLLQSTKPQSVVVSSESMAFNVLPLPMADQPRGFSGAVGKFQIRSELSSTRTRVGEPFTLRMRVLGEGNFDRVSSGMLADVDDWKSYRPTARFTRGEGSGHHGEKVFEQAVVATSPGFHRLPGLEFSYFDPDSRRYETARSAPLGIDVEPGADPVNTGSAQSLRFKGDQTVRAATIPTAGATRAADLRNDHAARDSASRSLVPLYLQPRFLSVPVLLLFALTGAWFKQRRGEHASSDPRDRSSSETTTADLLALMDSAAMRGDCAVFFRCAGRILHDAGVGHHDVDVREMTTLADAANYSGETPGPAELQRCRRMVISRVSIRSVGCVTPAPSGHGDHQ